MISPGTTSSTSAGRSSGRFSNCLALTVPSLALAASPLRPSLRAARISTTSIASSVCTPPAWAKAAKAESAQAKMVRFIDFKAHQRW